MANNSQAVSTFSPLLFLRRILNSLFIALTGAYGISISGFLLLRMMLGERVGFIGLLNSFVHLLIIPAVVLLPLSLGLRRWLLAAVLALPAFNALSAYGPLFLPRTAAAPPQSRELVLLSYNVNMGNFNTEAIVDIIRAADADVVAIQELNPTHAQAVEAQLSDLYPHQALHPRDDFSGQGVLSRYPITADEFWLINLGHQRVELDFDGQTLTLYNVHPVHPLRGIRFDGESRAEEVTDTLRRAANETSPTLIVGDFNLTDQTADYARITALYGDAYRAAGWGPGFTFPEWRATRLGIPMPLLARIDYVFHDAAFTPLEARVWPSSGGSDHRALLVRLAVVE
ncbi:MAG: endonuclease/exonuclease/phosphatase family protein [Anaerolineae bacterium]|nr:endonuclease/exonuclease/phosphatase family protein [Anaerolineae bacterium]